MLIIISGKKENRCTDTETKNVMLITLSSYWILWYNIIVGLQLISSSF